MYYTVYQSGFVTTVIRARNCDVWSDQRPKNKTINLAQGLKPGEHCVVGMKKEHSPFRPAQPRATGIRAVGT